METAAARMVRGQDPIRRRLRRKVRLPMTKNGLAHEIPDSPLSTLRVVALGATHPPRSTQLRRQLLLQHAAGLDEEAAIDRFVRYLHVSVAAVILKKTTRDTILPQ